MAIESRFRTRGGYSHVTPYSRQQSNGRVVAHKPPAPRAGAGRQAPTVSYAYVAAQRSRSMKASGNPPCPPPANLGPPPMMPPCSQVQGIQIGCAPMTQFNAGANMNFVAMPMTLPPPICNQAGLPQFGRLYEEFDRMKRNGFVVQPQPRPLQTPTPPLPPPATTMAPPTQPATAAGAEFATPRPISRVPSPVPPPMGKQEQQQHGNGVSLAGEGVFTTAMKLFMHSYMPTACFDCTVPVDDWGREAQALIAEVMTVGCAGRGQPARPHKSSWPDSGSRNASSDYDVTNSSSSSGPSPDKAVAPGWLDPLQRMDIHRHILEIKPSPYPGGSPLSVPSSASGHSSDNDADDESAASCNSSPASLAPRVSGNSTVRRPSYKKKHDSARVRLSMDSGYQSSSTDGGSSCHGSQASACGLDSDGFSSDIGSSCSYSSSSSSRPSSPTRGRDEPQFLSPTEVPPYLNALLEAPWIEKTAPRKTLPTPAPPMRPPHPVAGLEKPQQQPGSVEGAYTYHKHKEWITDEILEMIVVRDRLYKRMKKHPAPDIVDMYKKVRNMVVGMTRNAKRAHEKRLEDMRSGAPSAGGFNNNNNVYHYVAPKYRRLSSGTRRPK